VCYTVCHIGISQKKSRLWWFGQVEHKDDGDCMLMEIYGYQTAMGKSQWDGAKP